MKEKNFKDEVLEMIKLIKMASTQEILPRYGRVVAKSKGDRNFKDLVTQADLKSSKFILSRIRKKFPGSYSEEQKYEDRFDHDLIWQIDPVDGTQEFCEGFEGGYACHAALLKKKKEVYFPVAGIIYLPGRDKLWYTDGSGEVFFEDKGIKKEIPHYNRSEIHGYFRKVDKGKGIEKFYVDLGKKLNLKTNLVSGGGAGASISDLLEGKTNLIVMNVNYTKEWDLAMAEPIIRALGGFICDINGKEFNYNRKDSEGLGEPYNLRGYIISLAFKKEEILPHVKSDILDDRLKKSH